MSNPRDPQAIHFHSILLGLLDIARLGCPGRGSEFPKQDKLDTASTDPVRNPLRVYSRRTFLLNIFLLYLTFYPLLPHLQGL